MNARDPRSLIEWWRKRSQDAWTGASFAAALAACADDLELALKDTSTLPTPKALDEKHVQYVAAPVALIEAMNWGQWRKGVFIFQGPHGEQARMYLHGIEPWPMIREPFKAEPTREARGCKEPGCGFQEHGDEHPHGQPLDVVPAPDEQEEACPDCMGGGKVMAWTTDDRGASGFAIDCPRCAIVKGNCSRGPA